MKQKDQEGFIRTLIYALIVTLGMGLIWIGLVFILSKYAPWAVVIGGIITLVSIIVFTVLSTQKYILSISFSFWGSLYQWKLLPIIISAILIVILTGILFFYSG